MERNDQATSAAMTMPIAAWRATIDDGFLGQQVVNTDAPSMTGGMATIEVPDREESAPPKGRGRTARPGSVRSRMFSGAVEGADEL